MDQTRSVTARYSALQWTFWSAYCPIASFSAVYLQLKGYGTAKVGVLLALITIVSALVQPFLAASADRSQRLGLRGYLALLAAFAGLLLAAMLLPAAEGPLLLALLFLASVAMRGLEPLSNSVAAWCMAQELQLDFGVSRALGTLGFALTSLALGYAAKYLGADSLIVVSIGFTVLYLLALSRFPVMRPAKKAAVRALPCTLPQFVRRYPLYLLVLCGFFFIAVFHVMTETYLLNMMEEIGGDSGSVGVAMLLANLAEFCTIFFFERFRRRLSTYGWLRLTAVCFAVKALLFFLAPSVTLMYLSQLLQCVTYGFYAPTIIHFSTEEIAPQDMVKGQTACVAIFTLGGSLGNFLGGQILASAPARTMNFVAFLFACVGAVFILLVLRGRKKEARAFRRA